MNINICGNNSLTELSCSWCQGCEGTNEPDCPFPGTLSPPTYPWPRTLCELLPQPRLKQGHSVVPHSPAMDTAELGPPAGPCPGLGLSRFSVPELSLKLSSGTIPELCPWLEWLNGPWLPGPAQMGCPHSAESQGSPWALLCLDGWVLPLLHLPI